MKETPLRPAASLASPSQDPAAGRPGCPAAPVLRRAAPPPTPTCSGVATRGRGHGDSPGLSCLGPSDGQGARKSRRATGQAMDGAAREARAGERRRRRNGTLAVRVGGASRVTAGRGDAARGVTCAPSASGPGVPAGKSAWRSLPFAGTRGPGRRKRGALRPPQPVRPSFHRFGARGSVSSSGEAALPRDELEPGSVGSATEEPQGLRSCGLLPTHAREGFTKHVRASHALSREISFPWSRGMQRG